MVDLNQLTFLQLDKKGLETLINWAKEEGWNPGPYDADVFWKTDPDGYYGYYYKNELIAGGSIVSYDGDFGFMGFFIVKPGLRSQGIGRKLWLERRNMLLFRLKPGAPIGMDGVVAMQSFYNNGGFEIAFRDERYEKKGAHFDEDKNISIIQENDLPEILSYDAQCFGFKRSQFLKPWIALPESHSFKYTNDGNVIGFAVLRKAHQGYKIGPLFADNSDIADALYKACLRAVPGENTYLDIPVVNEAAFQLVQKHKASYVFECARMYYGNPPKLPMDKIFGITTFELG